MPPYRCFRLAALGTAAAIGLTRGRFRGRRALEFFFVSPMVVPTIVLATGLYLLFARAFPVPPPYLTTSR